MRCENGHIWTIRIYDTKGNPRIDAFVTKQNQLAELHENILRAKAVRDEFAKEIKLEREASTLKYGQEA